MAGDTHKAGIVGVVVGAVLLFAAMSMVPL